MDDPYITFRYASHLASGQGLVYNPGEHVEGYSNFLWTVLLAGVIRVGGDPLLWSKLIGVALELLTITALGWCVRELLGTRVRSAGWRCYAVPSFAAAAYAVSWYPSLWSAGSLETPLFTALLVLSFAAALRERVALAAALLLLAALTRPEGILFWAVFLAVLVYRYLREHRRLPGPRLLARWMAPFAVPYGTFILWRLGYYGAPLPNTYYDKSGGALRFALDNGVSYLASFISTSVGWGPRSWPTSFDIPVRLVLGGTIVFGIGAVLLVRWAVRHGCTMLGLAGAWIALDFADIVWEGGDWMPGFRFAIPAYPFLVMVAAVGFGRVLELLPNGRPVLRAGALVGAAGAMALVSSAQLRTIQAQVPWVRPLVEVGSVQPEPSYRAAASWLHDHAAAGSLVAIEEAGLIPYYTDDLRFLDLFGLTDTHLARTSGQPPFGKEDNAYVLGRRPEYVLLWENSYADGTRFAPHRSLLDTTSFADQYRLLITLPRGTRDPHGMSSHFLLFARRDTSTVSRRPVGR